MKKFLNRKILLITFFIVLSIFLLTHKTYAYDIGNDFALSSTYNVEYVNSYLDINEDPSEGVKKLIDTHPEYFNFKSSSLGKYWILEKFEYANSEDNSSQYCYVFYFGHSPMLVRSNYGTESAYWNTIWTARDNRFSILFDKNGFYSSRDLDSDIGTLDKVNSSGETLYFYYFGLPENVNKRTVISSNHDIYEENHLEGDPFFQLPELEKATTLAPVIQREKTKGTLQKVMTEIVQILPLIIVVVVSLVGLRKALKMLFMLLRQS